MKLAVLVVGLLLATTGLLTFAMPERLRTMLAWFTTGNRFSIAILGRLALGLVLLFGASSTRWPAAGITLGLIFLAGGAAIPVLGEERVARIVNWWLERPNAGLRGWSTVVMGTGAFIAWLAA